MKTKILACLVLSFLISIQAYAKNQILLIGGGGEPVGTKDETGKPILGTIFDNNIKNLRLYLDKNKTWNKEASFNGGHPATENILKTKYKDTKTSHFGLQNYKDLISKYESKLKNNEFAKDDKILIVIESHGALKSENEGTHSIATTNKTLENLEAPSLDSASLDDLKKITELAKEKGVKVGIIDQSCHSGSSLALANETTCVLSASGPNHYGLIGNGAQTDLIIKNLATSKNLEEVFLKSRRASSDQSFPMISTQEGIAVQNNLYAIMTPFLYELDPEADKLTPFMTSGKSDLLCDYDTNYQTLLTIIDQYKTLSKVSDQTALSDLKSDLQKYYNFQREMITDLSKINFGLLNTEEEIKADDVVINNETYSMSAKLTWRDLMTTDYEALANSTKDRLSNAKTTDEKINLQMNIDLFTKFSQRGKLLKKEHPELLDVQSKMKNFDEKIKTSEDLALSIGTKSRVLYDLAYQDQQKNKSVGPRANACRDFTL